MNVTFGIPDFTNEKDANEFIKDLEQVFSRVRVGFKLGPAEFIEGTEQTAPAAPPANGYRIFARDNGAGKTQLMVIFATGVAQQLAIQP